METATQNLFPELDKVPVIEKQVIQLCSDYNSIIVTEDTLPSAKSAHGTLSTKRVEISNIRKNGTTQFENVKKQFQTGCDKLIARITPVENKLKSDINAFEDDDAWKKATKADSPAAYETYLKKFDSPKFDYKGKNVLQAKAKIEAFENEKRQQLKNYNDFQAKCNSLSAYKTSVDAKKGLENLTAFDPQPESFGEYFSTVLELKEVAICNLREILTTLETREAEAAEIAREKAELERQKAEMKAEQDRIAKETEAKEAERKAEQDRIAKEQADKEAELERQKQEMKAEQERINKEQADKAAEQERRDKELADLKAKQEREQSELDRKNQLAAEGKIEVEGKVFEIALINAVKQYYYGCDKYVGNISQAIDAMNEGVSQGKKTWDDLTNKQRANANLRQNIMGEWNRLVTSFLQMPYIKEALNEGIIVKNDFKQF